MKHFSAGRIGREYLPMLSGTFMLAVGLNVFLLPGKLSSGGVSTVGAVLLFLFGVPLSLTNLAANAILLLAGLRVLGREPLKKTAVGILLLSLMLEATARFPTYTGDLLPASLAGGVLLGLGIGLTVRVNGSTGGSDLGGLMLHRAFPHLPVGTLILIIDCVVISLAGLVFRSLTVTLYSLITLFISSRVTNAVLSFGDAAKQLTVISPAYETIAAAIQEKFGRGVTALYGRGMYSGRDCPVLLCVVSPKELPKIIGEIRENDPQAFLIVADAREVLGKGFKQIP